MRLFITVVSALLSLCCMHLSAATIQIIVTNDAGTEQQNITITLDPGNGTGDDMLASLTAWRDGQPPFQLPDPATKFPATAAGDKAFWQEVVILTLGKMIDQFPYDGLKTKQTERETANRGVSDEVKGGFK